jgi:hypothetical protein
MTIQDSGIEDLGGSDDANRKIAYTTSTDPVEARLKALEEMDYAALRRAWEEVYQVAPPRRVSRGLLVLGIAWKFQEQANAGHSASTLRRLKQLTQSLVSRGDVTRKRATSIKPGTRLIREWRGEAHVVIVLEEGFEWQGKQWQSLSEIAAQITGTHWSGPRFFGLKPLPSKIGNGGK